jgi:hypothetical protein
MANLPRKGVETRLANPPRYRTNAERQAAYRRRHKATIDDLTKTKGLPAMPAVDSMPGWSRWNKAVHQVQLLLDQIQNEMQDYYDCRSEPWQESDRAEEFQQKLNELGEIRDNIDAWLP